VLLPATGSKLVPWMTMLMALAARFAVLAVTVGGAA